MLKDVDELPELLSNIDGLSDISNLFNQVGSLLGNISGTEEVVKYLSGISNIIGQIDGLVNLVDDIDSPQDALNAISGLLGTGGGLAREVVGLLGGDDFEIDDDSDDSDDDSGDDDNDFAGDDDDGNLAQNLQGDDDNDELDDDGDDLGDDDGNLAQDLQGDDDNDEDTDSDDLDEAFDSEETLLAANLSNGVVSDIPLGLIGGDDLNEGDFEIAQEDLFDESDFDESDFENDGTQIAFAPVLASVTIGTGPAGPIILVLGVGGIYVYENREQIAQFTYEAARNIGAFIEDLSDILKEQGARALETFENIPNILEQVFKIETGEEGEEEKEEAEGETDSGSENERDWSQDKILSKGEIKKLQEAGVDIHVLKGRKNASKKDLYKDRYGDIYVKPKGGRGPGEETGLNINDF